MVTGVAMLLLAALLAAGQAGADTHRTHVFLLQAMQAEQAATLYERMLGLPPETRLVAGRDGKSLIAHDTPERLERFTKLLSALDRDEGAGQRIYVRPVLHRIPSELAELVRQVVGQAAPTLVADDRSGALVVRARWPEYQELDTLLRRLDVPARGERALRVTPGTETGDLPFVPGGAGKRRSGR